MKVPVVVTLTGGEEVYVECGPRAIAEAERKYDFTLTGSVSKGLPVETIAYMAWAQAARDGKYLAPWAEWWERVDDLEVRAPSDDPQ